MNIYLLLFCPYLVSGWVWYWLIGRRSSCKLMRKSTLVGWRASFSPNLLNTSSIAKFYFALISLIGTPFFKAKSDPSFRVTYTLSVRSHLLATIKTWIFYGAFSIRFQTYFLLYLIKPDLQTIEWVSACWVIDYDCAVCIASAHRSQLFHFVVSGYIPYFEGHLSAASLESQLLGILEVAESWLDCLWHVRVDKSLDDWRFAYWSVTQEYYFPCLIWLIIRLVIFYH